MFWCMSSSPLGHATCDVLSGSIVQPHLRKRRNSIIFLGRQNHRKKSSTEILLSLKIGQSLKTIDNRLRASCFLHIEPKLCRENMNASFMLYICSFYNVFGYKLCGHSAHFVRSYIRLTSNHIFCYSVIIRATLLEAEHFNVQKSFVFWT